MKVNKALIGVLAAVAAAAVIIVIMVINSASKPANDSVEATPTPAASVSDVQGSPDPASDETTQGDAVEQTSSPETEKTYTPTFMYFVSNSDEGYDATMVMIDELKKEFDTKVRFDIRNIDDEPDLVNNFPVKDNTPTLIMLNTKNDISNIMFKTKDKDKLTEAIKTALAN